jgi:ubiquitin-conjugating enzyme E2 J2
LKQNFLEVHIETMAPQIATNRLRKELIKLKNDPTPGVLAEPNENDILIWHFAIRGPSDTPYEGGIYIGKIKFPSEYPFKAPSVTMITPSGRFQCNAKICMSMTDFHPESWNPLWSVGSILQGLQSFMASDELTTGGISASDSERRRLASESISYNNRFFPQLWEGAVEAAFLTPSNTTSPSNKVNPPLGERSNRRVIPKPKNPTYSNNEEDKNNNQHGSHNKESSPSTVAADQAEQRRLKNAKKRAKQKAKKASSQEGEKSRQANDSEEKIRNLSLNHTLDETQTLEHGSSEI